MSWGFVRDYDILPRPGWVEFLRRVTTPLMRARGVTVAYEGLEHVPSKPSLMVGNSTHRYEVVLLRWALDRRGIGVVIASKGKNYHAPWMRHFCVVAGSLPLVSRGYILTMDFLHVHGRRPTEEEYRALRDHVDAGAPLPDGPVFAALGAGPREVIGYPFSPSRTTYGECVAELYQVMMARTIELGRESLDAGYHLHVFPQGSVSSRLTRGQIGAVQLAHALGLSIVPVGINGCREVFPGASPWPHPAELRFRFGPARAPDLTELPADFRPFHPDDERVHRAVLERATASIMDAIDERLDTRYRRQGDAPSDGAQGTSRFVLAKPAGAPPERAIPQSVFCQVSTPCRG